MKHRGTKILALLLSFVLVLSLLPGMTAWADGTVVTTADEFFAAVNSGGSMSLANDITLQLDNNLYFKEALIIDLNGHTITVQGRDMYRTWLIQAPVTIRDGAGGGMISHPDDSYTFLTQPGGSLTLEGGTLEFTNSDTDGIDVYMGPFTMTGGTIKSAGYSIWRDGQPVTISGGTIIGDFLDSSGDLSITGGRFSFDISDLGYTAYKDGDYWVLGAATVNVESVTLDPAAATLAVGGIQKLTASVLPENATDKTVIWSVISGSDKVKLYSDDTCQTEVTQDKATGTLTVFVKGISAGGATVEATSANALQKYADCAVTVTANAYTVTVNPPLKGTVKADKTTAAAGETVTLTITPASGYQVQAIAVSDANNNKITPTGNSFVMPAADVYVTVQFQATQPTQPTEPTQPAQPAGAFTVTYRPGEGSGAEKQYSYKAGETHTVEGNFFTAPDGKEFDCWQGSDGNSYKPGAPVVVNANLTLTAQWKGKQEEGGNSGRIEITGDISFPGGGFGGGEEWYDGGAYIAPQRSWKVSLAPMVNGSAALGVMSGESTTTDMNVYPNTSIYVFPNPDPGYRLDKIIWSLIDGSASYDITEAKNFVMPAMDAVVYVTFKPVG